MVSRNGERPAIMNLKRCVELARGVYGDFAEVTVRFDPERARYHCGVRQRLSLADDSAKDVTECVEDSLEDAIETLMQRLETQAQAALASLRNEYGFLSRYDALVSSVGSDR